MANFPTSLDSTGTTLPIPTGTSTQNNPDHALMHSNANTAIIALENKVGIGAATPVANRLFTGTGTGTSDWSKVSPTGVIVGTTDTQILTNKTLTSPTINAPTITNATITADTVSGFSASTTGTIYGIAVTAGAITGANTINGSALVANTVAAAAIVNGSLTAAQIATGIQLPDKMKNPYKFSAYRAAAANTGNAAFGLVTFDTKEYDTGTNYSTATGVFTAPIAGFYHFDASIGLSGTYTIFILSLYKNGVEFKRGNDLRNGAAVQGSALVTCTIQLAANDTVDIRVFGNTAIAINPTQSTTCFAGFLVSNT